MAIIAELLGNQGMAEKDAEEVDGNNLADGGLPDHLAHWMDVLDRWVRGIDKGLGRQDRAAAPIAGDGEAPPAGDWFHPHGSFTASGASCCTGSPRSCKQ